MAYERSAVMDNCVIREHRWFAWRPIRLSTPDDVLPGPCQIAGRRGPFVWLKTVKRRGLLAGSAYNGTFIWWEYSTVEELDRVERAAIWHQGACYSVPRPGRHHDVMDHMRACGTRPSQQNDIQGFTTTRNLFVNRIEACKIATAAGQIIKKTGSKDKLFSEDVW